MCGLAMNVAVEHSLRRLEMMKRAARRREAAAELLRLRGSYAAAAMAWGGAEASEAFIELESLLMEEIEE